MSQDEAKDHVNWKADLITDLLITLTVLRSKRPELVAANLTKVKLIRRILGLPVFSRKTARARRRFQISR